MEERWEEESVGKKNRIREGKNKIMKEKKTELIEGETRIVLSHQRI